MIHRSLHAIASLVLLAASGAAAAQATVPLTVDTPVRTTLQAGSFTNAVYIDVPSDAVEMRVSLDSLTPDRDVDLLLRFDAPFPSQMGGQLPPDFDWLVELSHYRSVSATGQEFVVVNRGSVTPLAPGRWHLAAVNFAAEPADVELRVALSNQNASSPFTIDFDAPSSSCLTAPWNDASPAREPRGGNPGTTLGEQRRWALQEAVRIVSNELQPRAGARIRACWQADDGSSGSGGLTLAFASPAGYWVDDPGSGLEGGFLPRRHTITPRATAAHLAGTDACRFLGGNCGGHDLTITFSLAVESPNTLNGNGFVYGNQRQNFVQVDFIGVAIHEILHGVGYLGLVNLNADNGPLGRRLSAWDDPYALQVRYVPQGATQATPFYEVAPADMQAALTSLDGLRFGGALASASLRNQFRLQPEPGNHPRVHTVGDSQEIRPGSTFSHLGTVHTAEVMTASINSFATFRELGLARDVLRDVGWDNAPKQSRNFSLPSSIQYYDITRSGHGIDMQKVRGLDDFYFVTFYTFNADGDPEWFVAVGSVVEGVFMPARNANGDSLVRFLYNPGGPPFQIPDASDAFNGELRVDFVDAGVSPACRETRDDRSGTLAVMSWTLGDGEAEFDQWCVSPIIGDANRAAVDFSGTWYAGPTDSGWGFSVQSFRAGANDGLAFALYYADPEGRPQWAIAQSANYVPGEPMQLRRLSGYCRTCERPAGALQETVVGTVSIELYEPGLGQDRVSFDIDQGNGQRFVRELVPIIPVNQPRYRATP